MPRRRLAHCVVGAALGVAVIVVSAGAVSTLVLIGHSGTRAVRGGLLAA